MFYENSYYAQNNHREFQKKLMKRFRENFEKIDLGLKNAPFTPFWAKFPLKSQNSHFVDFEPKNDLFTPFWV